MRLRGGWICSYANKGKVVIVDDQLYGSLFFILILVAMVIWLRVVPDAPWIHTLEKDTVTMVCEAGR